MKKAFWLIILLVSVFLFTTCNYLQTNYQSSYKNQTQNKSLVFVRLYQPKQKGFESQSQVQAVQESESLFQRSAIPSYPDNDSDNLENLQWQFTFSSNISTQTLSFNSQELQKNDSGFLIPIPQGNWSLSVMNTFFEGYLTNLEITDTGFYKIELPVFFKTDGMGSTSLKINTADSGITKVLVKHLSDCTNNNSASNIFEDFYFPDDSNIITIYKENIPVGTYNLILHFFQEDLCVLSLAETVNIRTNCITNKWIEDFYDIDGINIIEPETNTLFISKELIRAIRGNVFYAKDQVEQSIIPDGSAYTPFSSLQQAIDLITYLNDEESQYLVVIDGIISPQNFSSKNLYNAYSESSESFTNVSSDKQLHLKLQGQNLNSAINALGDENNKRRVMEISGKIQLEIKDLIITGGYTEENGAGIYISTPVSSEPNLILSGRTKITENYTSNSGGGLYIDEGAVLIKDNAEISSNMAITKGGGICILGKSGKDKRTLEIQGGRIANNTALSKNKNTGVGGGLYTQFGIIHINNCLLSQNQAANGGGIGIAQNSNIYITNSLITENTAVYGANSSKGGGGIFASGVSANLYLQEGCCITNNYTNSEASKGGGISITTTNVHISSNVNISDNYYLSSALGVNLSGNVFLQSGKVLSIDQALENVLIGITTADIPDENTPVTFTNNYSRYNRGINPSAFFFSDDTSYAISLFEDGESQLIIP